MNISTVNELIQSLESGGELSIKERKYLELAKEFRICSASLDAAIKTGNVLADQNAQLAAENVGLKAGVSYFSYGSEYGFEWHKTENEAVEAAESAIDDYRGAACDGWSEEVDSICFGIIMRSSTKVGERPRNEDDSCDPSIDTVCDYALLPDIETPATDRIVAGIKADAQSEVIEWLDAEITAIDTMYRGDPSYERDAYWMKSEVLDVVELARKAFSAQLREGAK